MEPLEKKRVPDTKSKGAQLRTNTTKNRVQPDNLLLWVVFMTWPNTKSKTPQLKTNTTEKSRSARNFYIIEGALLIRS